MKIKYLDDKTVIYLYRYKLNLNSVELLSNDIKNLFIKLIKVYKLDLSGLIEVTIFENTYYGYVLEIKKLNYFEYQDDIIDLKLNILNNCDFYFKCNNYYLLDRYSPIYYREKNFFVNIDKVKNVMEIIEHGSIVYDIEFNNYERIK